MTEINLSYIELVNGPKIAYALNGPDDGPCILLSHGWTGGIHEFYSVIPDLNTAGWQTLAIRMPRDETSESFSELSSYSMIALADMHHDIAERLGVVPVVVLGFSMGGAIADEFVLRHPDDARALIVLGSAGFDWVDEKAQTDIDEAEPIVFDEGMEAHYDIWKQRTDSEANRSFDEAELAKRRAWWARTSPNAYVGGLYGLRDKQDTLQKLVALAKPTLIVHGHGEEDSIIEASMRASEQIPSSVLRVIPNSAHFAQNLLRAVFPSWHFFPLHQPEFLTFTLVYLLGGRSGGVRHYIHNYRNLAHHWPRTRKAAHKRLTECRHQFLEGMRLI